VELLAEMFAPHPDDPPPTPVPDLYRPGLTVHELLTWVRSRADHSRSRAHIRARTATEMDNAWHELLNRTGTAADLDANVDDLDVRSLAEGADRGTDQDRETVRLIRLSLICHRSWKLDRQERHDAKALVGPRTSKRTRAS